MDKSKIMPGMRVLTRDGRELGIVESIIDDGFTIRGGGTEGRVRFEHVESVDKDVRLDRDSLDDGTGVGTAAAGTAAGTVATRRAAAHADRDARSGLGWLIPVIAGLITLGLLIWMLSQCSHRDRNAADQTAPATTVATPNTGAAGTMLPALQTYLASNEAAPRTFTFDRLNFDTSSSAIRPDDQQTISQLAQALQAHPNARIRITGYADARGAAGTNAKLGEQRAQAVVAALSQAGVDHSRLEVNSGGEQNPRDTNANPQGRFENRRTELTVLKK